MSDLLKQLVRRRMPVATDQEVAPCQPRARTERKPETRTGNTTTTKLALTSIAAVEHRPGIDMVRRRSTDRWSSPTCAKRRVPDRGVKTGTSRALTDNQ